jgi:hypothetical protein
MRKVIRALFDDPHGLQPEEVQKSKELKKLIKQQAPECIRLAFESNKQYATLFEINDSSYYVELHKKNWVQALETCLLWYVEEENYEMCTSIKDLVKDIQSRGNKNKLDLNGGEGF